MKFVKLTQPGGRGIVWVNLETVTALRPGVQPAGDPNWTTIVCPYYTVGQVQVLETPEQIFGKEPSVIASD